MTSAAGEALPGCLQWRWSYQCRWRACWLWGGPSLSFWRPQTCRLFPGAAGWTSLCRNVWGRSPDNVPPGGTPPAHRAAPHTPARQRVRGREEQWLSPEQFSKFPTLNIHTVRILLMWGWISLCSEAQRESGLAPSRARRLRRTRRSPVTVGSVPARITTTVRIFGVFSASKPGTEPSIIAEKPPTAQQLA